MFLQFLAEFLAGFHKLFLLRVVRFLNLCQLSLKLFVMAGQRIELSLQHLDPGRGNDASHVRNHGLGQDVVDQAMIPGESGMSHMLDTEAVIRIFFVLSGLNVDTSFGRTNATRFRIFDDGLASRFGLHVSLVGWGRLVDGHVAVVLLLLGLVLFVVLLLLVVGHVAPHLPDDPADFPQSQLGVGGLDRVPDFP